MGEWKEYKLGDLIDVKHGYAFKGAFFSDEPTPDIVLTPGNFKIGGGFKADKFKYYNGEYPPEYLLSEGDVIVTMTDLSQKGDTLGYSAKIPKAIGVRFLHNQRLGLVRLKSEQADLDFIYWLMRTSDYQDSVVNSATGSTVKHTSPTTIKEYDFRFPPLTQQRAIASMLSSLDDKIDLLHRQNKTLERLADTLWRQWFVVQVDGWHEITLREIAEHVKESVSPSKQPTLVFSHYSVPAYDEGRQPKKEFGKNILSNKFRVISDSILISKLNPKFPRVWPVFGQVDETSSICSTEFQVVKPKHKNYFGFIYCFLKSRSVTQELESAVGGTSGSHQRVDPEVIFDLSFPKPPGERIEEFGKLTNDHWIKIDDNFGQIRTLTQMRDTLLPKLMSGEVRVEM